MFTNEIVQYFAFGVLLVGMLAVTFASAYRNSIQRAVKARNHKLNWQIIVLKRWLMLPIYGLTALGAVSGVYFVVNPQEMEV